MLFFDGMAVNSLLTYFLTY